MSILLWTLARPCSAPPKAVGLSCSGGVKAEAFVFEKVEFAGYQDALLKEMRLTSGGHRHICLTRAIAIQMGGKAQGRGFSQALPLTCGVILSSHTPASLSTLWR